jgi:hypothetical protein
MLPSLYEGGEREIRFSFGETTEHKAEATQKDKNQRQAWFEGTDTKQVSYLAVEAYSCSSRLASFGASKGSFGFIFACSRSRACLAR